MATQQSTAFAFGSFNSFCDQIAMSLCPLVGPNPAIEPTCYSRNIEISRTLIFEPATLVMHIIALIMTAIMIFHIRSKYTAVGRKEIVMFFYIYFVMTIIEFLTVGGIIPTASSVYPWFVAVQTSLTVTAFWCLFLNGFVPFQWTEDGTPLSLWSIRLTSLIMFVITYIVSIATFKNTAGLNSSNPVGLFVLFFVLPLVFTLIYLVLQIILVVNTLDDRWPLGDILLAAFFFTIAQIVNFAVSDKICRVAKHYVDGMFFGTICTLLAVMMVYKYWDSITKEDLEFSVGGKNNMWEIRDPLLSDDAMAAQAHAQAANKPADHRGSVMAHPAYGATGVAAPPMSQQPTQTAFRA
ncbi:hypothetical protein CXG81DRAFT_9391 [Caulochytrium protostelioides]|uniref:Chitin synthase export chaperone n=1 Tax=Caulochytrium protostelioides TaxID=1555241 RepID=A0A4V1IVC5_9FUNG|nr:chitin synthase export chaperone [Caulochytrium protostelioides]RKP03579.1 hypothetical protein CXG81DRAFT_9391 [Caulochytrium protostelioides]|eukprot:RKP03579.1 hypothetical protein CXG81DRAFT_9391 [Caulochytrium protostelioides]